MLSSLEFNTSHVQKMIAAGIASIAAIEVPRGEWLDLFDTVATAAKNETPSARLTAMILIHSIADEVDNKHVNEQQRYAVIDSVLRNLVYEGDNIEVAKVALKAFCYSLKYADNFFAQENERNVIMSKLFGAFEALKADATSMVQLMHIFQDIASKHYDVVQFYLQQFAMITAHFAKGGDDEVAPQALEFWTNLGEVEIDRK